MKFRRVGTTYVVRLYRGEEIIENLSSILRKYGVSGGTVTGIGALGNAVLGYFNEETKEYDKKEFAGSFELLSLKGNISLIEGETFPHLHVVLGDHNFGVFGGHLHSGIVSVTCEIFVEALDTVIMREPDEDTGLNLMKL